MSGLQVLEAAVDPRARGSRASSPRASATAAAGRPWWRQIVSPRPFAAQPRDQPLAAAVAVDVRGVDEVDAGVDRRVQRRASTLRRRPGPRMPPIAHAPKLIVETDMSVRPSCR